MTNTNSTTKTSGTLIHLGDPRFVACGSKTSGQSLRTRKLADVTCSLCQAAAARRRTAR